MSDTDSRAPHEGEHDRAIQRLSAAKEEQSRARAQRDRSQDTAGDARTEASSRAADDEVAARQRWLEAVDDRDY
jgi:hypothetical protein